MMRMVRYAAVFLLVGMLSASMAWAGEPARKAIGFCAAVKGRVYAVGADGQKRLLKIKSAVHEGEVIQTGKRGRLQMVFRDQTIISLGRDTEMTLAEYEFKPAEGKGKMTTRVKEGVFRVMGGKIVDGDPEKFRTETPTATIGIRGSIYTGQQRDGVLTVGYEGGKKDPATGNYRGIWVGNAGGRVPLTKPLMGTRVPGPGQAPAPPSQFTPEQMGAMQGGLAMGDDDDGDDGAGDGDAGDAGDDDDAAGDDETADDGDGGGDDTADAGDDDDGGDGAVADGDDDDGGDIGGDDGDIGGDDGDIGGDDAFADGTDAGDDAFNDPAAAASSDASAASADASQTSTTADTGISAVAGKVVHYEGVPVSDFLLKSPFYEQFTDEGTEANIVANFNNGRVIGILDHDDMGSSGSDKDAHMMFWGDIDGEDILNLHWTGIGEADHTSDPYYPFAVDGDGGSGSFSNEYNDVTVSGAGYLYEEDAHVGEADTGDWTSQSSGTKSENFDAPEGMQFWQGFVAGHAKSTSGGGGTRFFTNVDPNLHLEQDYDNGVTSGEMYFAEVDNATTSIFVNQAIKIGGTAATSAVVAPELFVATIDAPTGTELKDTYTSSVAGINPHSAYMMSENPDRQWGADVEEYLHWGWWEMNFKDPGVSGYDYVMEGHWVAGLRTPESVVNELLGQTGLVGVYNGGAEGILIDTDQNLTDLQGGTSRIKIDFETSTLVGGGESFVKFDATQLNFNEMAVTAKGYSHGTIAGSSESQVNGTFYGPNAEVTGGNFYTNQSGDRYYGVFGGKR